PHSVHPATTGDQPADTPWRQKPVRSQAEAGVTPSRRAKQKALPPARLFARRLRAWTSAGADRPRWRTAAGHQADYRRRIQREDRAPAPDPVLLWLLGAASP